jgi:putative addiction module component (TIGR02574 family)
MSIYEVEALALQLPRHERAELARQLLESLEEPDEVALDWEEEAESRLKALSSGEVETVSSEEVLEELRRSLR